MTATRAEQAQLRREGMADALVLLVAHRTFPRLDLEDLARPLGITRLELQAAVGRFRARAEAAHPKPRLAVVGGSRPRRYTNAKPCPKGCGRTFVHFGRHLQACTGEPA